MSLINLEQCIRKLLSEYSYMEGHTALKYIQDRTGYKITKQELQELIRIIAISPPTNQQKERFT